ncbi:ubiquinol-cytochrome c reductase iron-sulfur subunit [Streptomyces alkaliterrae]|uniref:Cytochrome bc1 complex Rieske iron-sulfur subunit n=1 Tax=Streptomyces alkaliterrae TaxID=2213162 RepID=A0A5P0YUS1_9ACTN|nr:Rieske (2Fe-2S) protein [Streptomyces alkaliterrae]MBB1253490.1 Rieske (2Fe-2S) protein [Streptomyces alkaliterrae]MBB1260102.1 Rieske (2Fe-2S) protein [Streptomyces alkaliterrae]MQS04051.1 Rieske 2Fe-2S domain-containing protein [Streptomyces alkaliterrae]
MTEHDCPRPSRRTLLCGAAAAPLAGLALTACGGDSWPRSPEAETRAVTLGGDAGEVPVGGARIYREDRLLVSQPKQGEFRAFSAVCTHGGCVLSSVRELEAGCGCHGSRFDAVSGAVLETPATVDLPEYPVTVSKGRLVVGPGRREG